MLQKMFSIDQTKSRFSKKKFKDTIKYKHRKILGTL